MKRFVSIYLVFLALLGVGALLLLSVTSTKTLTHRYKLTLTIDANGVKRSGSSIIEVNWIEQPQKVLPIPVPHFVARVAGDAPVVELDSGGAIVATLMRADPSYSPVPLEHLVTKAFRLADSDASIPDLPRQTGVRVLSGNEIPRLMYFSDRNDPKTARLVHQPTAPGEPLAQGVAFVEATIEMTSAPVTRTVEQSLPWWSNPGRPASVALRASRQGNMLGESIGPESLFRR